MLPSKMPIYAYRCQKCGAEEEHIQKMSDPPRKRCEACGGKLDKLMTSAAFQLRGGGWYADGYASTKKEGGSGGDKPSGDSSGKSSGKSDSSSADSGSKTGAGDGGSKTGSGGGKSSKAVNE